MFRHLCSYLRSGKLNSQAALRSVPAERRPANSFHLLGLIGFCIMKTRDNAKGTRCREHKKASTAVLTQALQHAKTTQG
jgi:hypothetical protein